MEDSMPVDLVTSIIQLATNGGFAALVWYLVIKHVPAIEARHQLERTEWLTYIKQRDITMDGLVKQYYQSTNELSLEVQRLRETLTHKEL